MHVPVYVAGIGNLARRLGISLVFSALFVALNATAQSTSGDAVVTGREAPSMRSPGGRFVVAAESAADRMLLSRWADDVYRRFGHYWKTAAELPPERTFGIVVASGDDGMLPGSIEARRVMQGVHMILTLRIEGVEALDGEQFIEAVCGMILEALILDAMGSDRMLQYSSAPQWLSVGTAQNLYPMLRSRNRRLVIDLWRGGSLPAIEEVLSWLHLSPYRGFEHAVSGVWVAWATEQRRQPAETLRHWIGLLAGTRSITPDNFLHAGLTAGDGEGWIPYVASLQRTFAADNDVGAAERYEYLRQALQVTPGLAGIPANAGLNDGDRLDALMPLRRESWMGTFVRTRKMDLVSVAFGGAPEYQALVNRISGFLDGLAGRRPRFLLKRDFSALLSAIDTQEEIAMLREQYLDVFEHRYNPYHPPAWLNDDRLDAPPRSRMRSYVDGFDKP